MGFPDDFDLTSLDPNRIMDEQTRISLIDYLDVSMRELGFAILAVPQTEQGLCQLISMAHIYAKSALEILNKKG